jgi:hypothetical protein
LVGLGTKNLEGRKEGPWDFLIFCSKKYKKRKNEKKIFFIKLVPGAPNVLAIQQKKICAVRTFSYLSSQ